MRWKKIITATLAVSMLVLSSCVQKTTDYSVLLITDSVDSDENDSFNGPAIEGLKAMKEKYGIKQRVVQTSDNNFEKSFSEVNSTTDLIITLGYSTRDAAVASAKKNSDKKYIAIDCEGEDGCDNFTGICYRVEESSFLVGYIAGMTTTSNKLGFVGGTDADTIKSFEYGFRAGVAYAAKELNKEITVDSGYVGSFDDRDKGQQTANSLYLSGCDIVFQAAGISGLGVIDSAKANNKFVIGVDVDQSYLAPNNVLTSALKDVKYTVIFSIGEYIDERFFESGTKYMNLKDGGVGIPQNNPLVPKAVLDRTYELRDLIIDGKILPPDTEAEYNEFLKTL